MMDTQLYLRVRGRVLGPYDEEKLQSLVRRGQLSRMHEVSTDGAHWVRASTYAELFVGAPVRLVAPEMAVAAPPPAQQATCELIPIAEEPVPQTAAAPAPTSRAAASAANGKSWYYESLGAEHGPVEESALRMLLATGQLDSNSLVWNDSMPQWSPAFQVPGLVPAAGTSRTHGSNDRESASAEGMASLCKAAHASRPWALFLGITAFVYAGLLMLVGFIFLVQGAEHGIPPVVAMGLFWIINGAVTAAGGILLINYANRLASLIYSSSCKVLESAMDRLRTFWMFISIVLIVVLAFIGFFVVWMLALGISLPHYM